MSDLTFVIESSFRHFGEPGYEVSDNRPKRVKHACLGCQARKGRCSGTTPCDVCKAKNVPCIYRDNPRSGRSSKVANITKPSSSTIPGSTTKTTTATKSDSLISIKTISANNENNDPRLSKKPRTSSSTSIDTNSSSVTTKSLRTTRQPYFRWLGPTAIAPPKEGTFRLLSVNLRSNELPNDSKYVVIERTNSTNIIPTNSEDVIPSTMPLSAIETVGVEGVEGVEVAERPQGTELLSSKELSPPISEPDNMVPLPSKELYKHFSDHMSNYLPYLPYDIFEERLSNGVIGECLLYAMASLAERVTPSNLATANSAAVAVPPMVRDNSKTGDSRENDNEEVAGGGKRKRKSSTNGKKIESVDSGFGIGSSLPVESNSNGSQANETNSSTATASGVTSATNGNYEVTASTSLAEKYADAAKRLIIPHLSCPSTEIVFALLLIAYCEFGDDRDSGLWSWSGMAIRMCYDLGLHKANNASADSDVMFSRNVFWSVVCLDRLISCGTGRITTIPDSVIEHAPEPRWISESASKRSDPFPYLCKLLILLGNVSNYLNTYVNSHNDSKLSLGNYFQYNTSSSSKSSSLSPESLDLMETFVQFQQEVSDFYTTLPPDLLFDVQNFQDYAKLKYSQVFLLLHIWNQALVLAVHQPSLVYPKCQLDVTGLVSNPHAELTGTGAISIADMVTFADLIKPESFLANPFLSQPIYMAACASLTLWHSLRAPLQSQPMYTLQRTYNTCRQTLNRMGKIWRGISWHSKTLDSLAASEPDVDLSVDSKVYVTTKDLGVVRRASVDESTRRWLAGQIQQKQADDIYGMFISGIIDGKDNSPSSSNGGGGSGGLDHLPPHQHLPSEEMVTGRANENGMTLLDLDYKTPMMNPVGNDDNDTFRNLVIRNMNLDEFLNNNYQI